MRSKMNGKLSLCLLLCVLSVLLLMGCDGGNATQAEDVSPAEVVTPLREDSGVEAPVAVGDAVAPADVTNESGANDLLAVVEGTGVLSIDGVVSDGEYSHSAAVARMTIHWSNDAETLHMALVAPGTGYVAVGFDPVNRKMGANYILGWVDEKGATLRDHIGTRGNLHEPDTALGGTDDLIEFAGTEAEQQTTIEFAIPLDSGDAFDRPLVPGGRYVLHAAYHRSRDDDFSVHTGWGIGELTLDAIP